MSNDNWYSVQKPETASAAQEPQTAAPRQRKGLTPWRVAGIILLLVLIIVASSLAFSGGSAPAQNVDFSGSGFPEDRRDFFENYYTDSSSTQAEIGIEQAELPIDFQLELIAPAAGEELSLQELYQSCAESIVAISSYLDDDTGYSWGTGIVLTEDGLILTNTHMIDGCDRSVVTLPDDSQYEALLVGADSISDIAVLKIEAEGLTPAQFGESSSLAVGDRVAAIGNPLGEAFRSTMTDGIISAIERGVRYNGHTMTLLQTNTAINDGNSGGALFNMYGQVVGITNMKMMSSYSSIEGIGFAIPSQTVQSVVNSLVNHGKVIGRPAIGITVGAIPESAASEYDMPLGLYVSKVESGSDAEKQGIKAGDVITQVNGSPVTNNTQLSQILDELQVGDSLSFEIWREGETLEIDITLMDTLDIYDS